MELCLKAGENTEAEKVFRGLLHLNPENFNYYAGLQKALGLPSQSGIFASFLIVYTPMDVIEASITHTGSSLTPEQENKLHTIFTELQKLFPRANAPKRLVLDFLDGALASLRGFAFG